jgi:hypothetical protein
MHMGGPLLPERVAAVNPIWASRPPGLLRRTCQRGVDFGKAAQSVGDGRRSSGIFARGAVSAAAATQDLDAVFFFLSADRRVDSPSEDN